MDTIISHTSSVEYLRGVPPSVYGTPRLKRRYDLHDSASTKHLCTFDPRSIGLASSPVHILSARRATRSRSKRFEAHLFASALLPADSLIWAAPDILVCGPELAFFQISRLLDPIETIAIGSEFCSQYSLFQKQISGFYERPALSDVNRMKTVISSLESPRNQRPAIRLLSHIVSNAYSPMETILALLLSLPQSIGGYGFVSPTLNHELPLDSVAQRLANRRSCKIDLAWNDVKIGVEYDGRIHDDPAHDRRRREALLHMGWQIFSADLNDLKSIESFERRIVSLIKDIVPQQANVLKRGESTTRKELTQLRVTSQKTNQPMSHAELLEELRRATRWGLGPNRALFPFRLPTRINIHM